MKLLSNNKDKLYKNCTVIKSFDQHKKTIILDRFTNKKNVLRTMYLVFFLYVCSQTLLMNLDVWISQNIVDKV